MITMDPANTLTHPDYRRLLSEIDSFGDPAPGSAEFERLNGLVTQAEEYEAEHFPMGTPSAEAVAEYEAEKRGITASRKMSQAATLLGADAEARNVEFAFAAQAEIVLSDRDYALFEEIMTQEHEPTELALRGAAEFMSGTMEGSRYRW